jgi:thioredoxin-related protein
VNGLQKEFPKVKVQKVETSSPYGKDLAERWRVRLVPTFIALSGSGAEIDRAEGFQPPARLRRMFSLCSTADRGFRHED